MYPQKYPQELKELVDRFLINHKASSLKE